MPRYYFSIENGEPIRDPVPEELRDDDAARNYAEAVAEDLQRNRLDGHVWTVIATNEDGEKIAAVRTLWSKEL